MPTTNPTVHLWCVSST